MLVSVIQSSPCIRSSFVECSCISGRYYPIASYTGSNSWGEYQQSTPLFGRRSHPSPTPKDLPKYVRFIITFTSTSGEVSSVYAKLCEYARELKGFTVTPPAKVTVRSLDPRCEKLDIGLREKHAHIRELQIEAKVRYGVSLGPDIDDYVTPKEWTLEDQIDDYTSASITIDCARGDDIYNELERAGFITI